MSHFHSSDHHDDSTTPSSFDILNQSENSLTLGFEMRIVESIGVCIIPDTKSFGTGIDEDGQFTKLFSF